MDKDAVPPGWVSLRICFPAGDKPAGAVYPAPVKSVLIQAAQVNEIVTMPELGGVTRVVMSSGHVYFSPDAPLEIANALWVASRGPDCVGCGRPRDHASCRPEQVDQTMPPCSVCGKPYRSVR